MEQMDRKQRSWGSSLLKVQMRRAVHDLCVYMHALMSFHVFCSNYICNQVKTGENIASYVHWPFIWLCRHDKTAVYILTVTACISNLQFLAIWENNQNHQHRSFVFDEPYLYSNQQDPV